MVPVVFFFMVILDGVCSHCIPRSFGSQDANLDRIIPLAVHGDEADSHRRRSFSILTIHSLTVHGTLFDKKFLIYCLDNSVAHSNTAATLERYVAHSLAELQTGTFSGLDPWNRPFSPKHRNLSDNGQICGGWKFVLSMVKGDEKWHQRTFRTSKSWVSSSPCLHCSASSNNDQGLIYTSFGPNAAHRSTLTSNTDFIQNIVQCHTWTTVPGFHISMVVYDWLHVTDLCIVPECSGSALKLVYLSVLP